MSAYELLQIPRGASELRCALAAQARPRAGDDAENAVARVLETCDVVVDPRDRSVAHHMLTVGFWEWWITRAIADCMRPGTTCVDVGANAGYFAAVFVALGARDVVAVEPHPRLAQRLRATAARNGWSHLRVVETAVGDAPGRAHLFVQGDDNLGGSCLLDAARDRTIEVPVRTLDDVLAGVAGIQVLKIDCEGYEPRIWRGMQRVLASNPDVHVFAELTVNGDAAPWLAELEAQGWPLRFVDHDAELRPLCIEQIGERPLWMLYLHRD
jgi:FkbM family methyltransferase